MNAEKEWREKEDDLDNRRQRAIEQNGNNGEHYVSSVTNDSCYSSTGTLSSIHTKNISQEQRFEDVVDKTLTSIRNLLITKGKEYRRYGDVYHNFEDGAVRTGLIREKVLDGFLLKHEVSINDMTNDLVEGILPTEEKVEEKFNDNLIYLLIKKAMILDTIHNEGGI